MCRAAKPAILAAASFFGENIVHAAVYASSRFVFAGPGVSVPTARQSLATRLQAAADAYQRAHVIPHCAVCVKPCCRLDTHVLELNWQQVKVLWRLDEPRSAFDRRLASGKGPDEIRAADGLYFAHRKVCPAYDEAQHACRIHDQPIKPSGCSDYPVYGDGDVLIADLRCEAVDVDALAAWVVRELGPVFRVTRSADCDFPFLVTLAVKRRGGNPKARAGRR